MFQIYCCNQISKIGLERFGTDYTFSDTISLADAVLVRSASMYDMCFPKNLKVIARAGVGVNNIPLQRCTEQGIVVLNTPGANANGVKELVLAGLLLAGRHILEGIDWVRQQENRSEIAKRTELEKKQFAGMELKGKTIGVIGLGAIGSQVAEMAAGLGMHVLGYDPYLSQEAAEKLPKRVKRVSELYALLQQSDFLTLHIPVTEQTKKMVDREWILQMKPQAVLLNFARDCICQEQDVLAALDAGRLSYYVTDFPNAYVAGKKRCIVIPHLGASTKEAEEACAVMAVTGVQEYLERGTLKNAVNYPDCDMGICKGNSRIAILHKNIPKLQEMLQDSIHRNGIDIVQSVTNTKAETAYTLIDLETYASKQCIEHLQKTAGVQRIRQICCVVS